MATASALRAQIEAQLGTHIPAAFTARVSRMPELLPTGIAPVDALLEGGVPRGHLTEVTGEGSTGRTGLALGVVAVATRKGASCAWVDTQDAFDPESAAACGVDLERLLWLRAGVNTGQKEGAEERPVVAASQQAGSGRSHAGLHPRNETRDMDRAVSQLFQGKEETRVSFAPRCAEPQPHRRKLEQTERDRIPARRGEAVLKQYAPPIALKQAAAREGRAEVSSEKPWSRLEQALRATDLLLQAGGFSVVVLDLCDLRREHVMRIPVATWYRLRLAAEQAQTALVLLTESPCAKSCTALLLYCDRAEGYERWQRGNERALFAGLPYRVRVDRKRGDAVDDPFRKKPVANAQTGWRSRSPWAR